MNNGGTSLIYKGIFDVLIIGGFYSIRIYDNPQILIIKFLSII